MVTKYRMQENTLIQINKAKGAHPEFMNFVISVAEESINEEKWRGVKKKKLSYNIKEV